MAAAGVHGIALGYIIPVVALGLVLAVVLEWSGRRRKAGALRGDGMSLGLKGRRVLRAEEHAPVLVLGPERTGKTAGVVIPAVLEAPGGVLAVSVRGDVWKHCHKARERRGPVACFDPFGQLPVASASWSPLTTCRSISGAQAMAKVLQGARGGRAAESENSRYFSDMAYGLLWPVLWVAANSGGKMSEAVAWIISTNAPLINGGVIRQGCELSVRAAQLRTQARQESYGGRLFDTDDAGADLLTVTALEAELDGYRDASLAWRSLWGVWQCGDPRTMASVYSTARTYLEPWTDPGVAAVSERADITARFLLDGGTVFVTAPPARQSDYKAVFTSMLTSLMDAMVTECSRLGQGQDSGWLPAGSADVLVAVDEAGNVADMPKLTEWSTTCAGNGITLLSCWHSFGQLKDRFGPQWETVYSNARAKLLLSRLAGGDELERACRALGEVKGKSRGSGRDWRPGETKPRLTPAEVRQQRDGYATLVYGNRTAETVKLRRWWKDRKLQAMAEGIPAAGAPSP